VEQTLRLIAMLAGFLDGRVALCSGFGKRDEVTSGSLLWRLIEASGAERATLRLVGACFC